MDFPVTMSRTRGQLTIEPFGRNSEHVQITLHEVHAGWLAVDITDPAGIGRARMSWPTDFWERMQQDGCLGIRVQMHMGGLEGFRVVAADDGPCVFECAQTRHDVAGGTGPQVTPDESSRPGQYISVPLDIQLLLEHDHRLELSLEWVDFYR